MQKCAPSDLLLQFLHFLFCCAPFVRSALGKPVSAAASLSLVRAPRRRPHIRSRPFDYYRDPVRRAADRAQIVITSEPDGRKPHRIRVSLDFNVYARDWKLQSFRIGHIEFFHRKRFFVLVFR